MHEHWRLVKQNPTQKFCKNLINFEKKKKTKFFKKTQKVREKNEMHD